MKKLTNSVLTVVLSSTFVMVSAQKTKQDTAKTKEIEGVVVTALGIKREKKSLGYSSQEIKADAITKGTTNTGNVASQLSGKVAGLQVNTNNNFGGSSNLVIRGYKSLSGGNPLIVIDGSPVNNSTNSGYSGQYDYGNFLSDINQEDIESINVLKGAAASALYGERGLNGVIVITTKSGKGKDDNRWGVTINTGGNFGFVDKSTFPEYQNQYGGGYAPGYNFGKDYTNYNDDASLGPKYDGHMVYFWDSFDPTSSNYGKMRPYVAAQHTPADFFETASNYTNTLSLQKSGDKGSILINYTNQLMTGVLPNSDLRKNTVSAKFDYKLTDKLTATVYSSLTLQDTKGRNETGYSDNIASSLRQWWNTDSDMYLLRDAYNRTGKNVSWNRKSPTNGAAAYWDNPYFQRYQSYQSDDRTRIFSYAMLNYKFSKNVNATAKLSIDNVDLLVENRLAVGSVPRGWGQSGQNVTSGYSKQNIKQQEMNFDLFANYKFDLAEGLDLSGMVGGNVRRNYNTNDYTSTEGGLVVPGLYSLANSASTILPTWENSAKLVTAGVYATASLGYKDTYFLDGTYRIDKASTLPKDNRVYGYGSVTGAIVLSNFIKQDWLSFWKLRGNYAVVGGSAQAYQLQNVYTTIGNYSGTVLYDTPNTLAKSDLKPERSKEFEIGTELQFFKRRLGLDFNYYSSKTTDQIIQLAVSAGTGYSFSVFNAGRIDNKGYEVSLNATPIKSRDFSWDMNINWAKNKSEVVDLNGVDNYQLNAYQGGVSLNASVGQPFGTLVGTDYVYKNGQRVVGDDGLWVQSEKKVIGNITPDWTGGLRNTFSYKGLSLSFLIDVQKGGSTFSTDTSYGYAGGLYADTVGSEWRDPKGVVLPGVKADGSPNTTPIGNGSLNVNNYYSYQPKGYNNAPNSEFVYDTSYVKLREASISYRLPKSILENTFLEDVTVSLVGRNLWIIHKNVPYADPEAGVTGGLRSRGNSIGLLPTTRDIGFNVTIKF
ncbi:SusC/RagA family TonB-linked outer membrane protein [Elizabethkingia anophelis]|uniref:SusC/RagA family TonB-linked outer membrane protein n=1 Tax=Elizabethkingia anophelis TaxID=1117645 RepID=UPI000995B07E|nr:SusC/RagA family TonB-linked outer membrane protein [Elizabethkingia anophelis]AQW93421.1 SusC/RagA family protein [Elizabethkingia anophelis]MCT4295975.1 SusC/RagA family TonB-linked outer membrane protein [Elizabethkingia anophelis]MCT4299533.1 SusC/RagA family TonB-linked outer membrane protein [Elizabethkingia anophelis]MDV3854161.1 SusC/RagA family TonB-linked outer membrane protein [Elizabethkingia anophelis]MDV3861116.1 SusC/RagA family TonB-linked outer membrane protein [Elizabethki